MNKIFKFFKDINTKHKNWIKGRGYKYSKPLMISFFIISLILLGFVAYFDGFKEKMWVGCPDYGAGCRNPLAELEGCTHYCCEIDFLAPGSTCGEPTSWLGLNYGWIIWSLFLITLLLNHFLFNKGYDFNKYWGDFK